MKPHVSAIITSAAVGAVLATTLHPGIPEIAILWILGVGLSYGLHTGRARRLATAAQDEI